MQHQRETTVMFAHPQPKGAYGGKGPNSYCLVAAITEEMQKSALVFTVCFAEGSGEAPKFAVIASGRGVALCCRPRSRFLPIIVGGCYICFVGS